MQLSTWLLFSGIAFLSILSPGPAVLLAVTNGLRHGMITSICSSLGNIAGILMISGAAILGLGAVLQTSAFLFTLLKVTGAVYLIFLGVRQWQAEHHLFGASDSPDSDVQSVRGKRKSFVQGFLVALSNPKAVLFFTALFPQFIDLSKPVAIQFAILTSTFMLLSFLTLVMYARSAHFFKEWFSSRNRRLWFNRLSGAVFITFGLGILRLRNRAVS